MEIFEYKTGAGMPVVCVLGFFDCMHLGHAALLSEGKRMAERTGAKTALLTFRGGPDLGGEKTARTVLTFAERLERMAELGADAVIAADFDAAFASTPPEAFLEGLAARFRVRGLVCGYDYRYGAGAAGNAETLASFAAERGLDCAVVPEVDEAGERVSTSLIKRLLAAGDAERASRLLGAPYRVTAVVEPGRKVGRTLGFPTLNFTMPREKYPPKDGVYFAHACVGGKRYNGLANLGPRPTFGIGESKLEVWLKDFSGDLYGRTVTVFFDGFLRDVMLFPGADALKAQLGRDMARVQ